MTELINTPVGRINLIRKPVINVTEKCRDRTIFVASNEKKLYAYFPYHGAVVESEQLIINRTALSIVGYKIKDVLKKFSVKESVCYDLYIMEKYIDNSGDAGKRDYSLEDILNRHSIGVIHGRNDTTSIVLNLSRMPQVLLHQVNVLNSMYKQNDLLPFPEILLYDPLSKRYIKTRLRAIPVVVELKLVRIIVELEKRGLPVDTVMLYEIFQKTKKRYEEERNYFYSIGINSMSQKSLTGLNGDMKEKIKKFRKLKASFDKLKEFIKYYRDGRIVTNFEQTDNLTFSVISSKANVQNLDRELRNLCSVTDGYAIVSGDFSQIEARVAAVLYDDKRMIDAFTKGLDIHSVTASELLGIPPDRITPELRRKAKAINFGLMYGMSARRLSEYCKDSYGIVLDRKESLNVRKRFLEYYQGINTRIKYVTRHLRRFGYVTTKTLMGRQITTTTLTASLNYPIQASRSEILKLATVMFCDELSRRGLSSKVFIVNLIHDEILVEAEQDVATAAGEILRESMIKGAVALLKKVPVEVKVRVSKRWL